MDGKKLYKFTALLQELNALAKELGVLGIYDFGQGQFDQPAVSVQLDNTVCADMRMNRMGFDSKLDKRYTFVNGIHVFSLEEREERNEK